jgi:signal transduction histidine kinase
MAVALNYFLHQYVVDQKEAFLFRQADSLSELLQQAERDTSLFDRFDKADAYNHRVNSIRTNLVVLDENSPLKTVQILSKRLTKKNEVNNRSLLERIMKGERVRTVGKFAKSDNDAVLTVGVPITDSGSVVGALFLHTPLQEVETGPVTKLILAVACIVSALAALILYVVSRKLSLPLIRMNRAAQLIGKGQFSQRIPVSGHDEIGQLAFTFNQMAAQLENLESLRKQLIANVSHELRTPLTAVKGFVQGMLDGMTPPEQQRRHLEIIDKEIHRLSVLLNTVLDLSAIESGHVAIECVPIRWSSLVQSLEEAVRLRTEEKGIGLIVEEPDGAPLRVMGDPERYKQVLMNLLDNAIRHTPAGGRIAVRSRRVDNAVEVQVADTGAGIEPAKLPFIWERFYTEDSSRTSHRERSGLGLTITKHLVEAMGGTIEVQSQLGQGTTFTLLLPVPPL